MNQFVTNRSNNTETLTIKADVVFSVINFLTQSRSKCQISVCNEFFIQQ